MGGLLAEVADGLVELPCGRLKVARSDL